jgi:aminopeptidase N
LAAGNITRAGNILTINLGTTLANNFIDSVWVYYQGTPPAVLGAAEGYQATDATSGQNFIYSLSESYEDRDWWPCKADMQDKIDSMDIV